MTGGRAAFIVNPTAGGGRGRRARDRFRRLVLEHGGSAAAIAATERRGHGTELARHFAEAGFDPIVAVGGDGTVHEVANGLLDVAADARPRLGVVPIGTGNDFARSVGIPRSLDHAVKIAVEPASASVRQVDAARCGDRYFVGVAGAGFDARVARAAGEAPAWMKLGTLPFIWYTLREVAGNRNVELTVTLDGGTSIRQRSLLVAVSNCRFSGGGMQLAPPAQPDDGVLDVCLVADATRAEVVRLLPTVFWGGHVRHPKVSLHRAKTVRIEGPGSVGAQADGEQIGGLPLEISVVPGALRVLTAGSGG